MSVRNALAVMSSLMSLMLGIGCTVAPKIQTIAQDPECTTSMEGYYHCKDAWTEAKPAIVLLKAGFPQVIEGQIVSQDDRGITFKPAKKSSREPEETYYEFSQLMTVINEEGNVVYGSVPKKFSHALALNVYLEPAYGSAYSSSSQPYILHLEPNAPFAFCMPGGVYKVSSILFYDNSNNIERGVDYSQIRITIDGGRSNYIGDLFLNYTKPEIADSTRVRDGVSIPYTSLTGSESAPGGLLNAAVALEKRGNVAGKRDLWIGVNDAYTAKCKSSLKTNVAAIAR
jgi:hypothetical protein